MEVSLYRSSENARRIKFTMPYPLKTLRKAVKKLNSSWYHHNEKLWSIINSEHHKTELISLFKKHEVKWSEVELNSKQNRRERLNVELSDSSKKALESLQKSIILKAYSASTLKTYTNFFIQFLAYFNARELINIQKEEIEGFLFNSSVIK